MNEAAQILEATATVVLVDWPSRAVPETLARAGYAVVVKGGPEPENYSAYEFRDGEVVVGKLGHPPANADLVYCHRPSGELPSIVALAKDLDASALWFQSGLADGGEKDPTGCWLPADVSRHQRDLAERAGLRYIDDLYIVDEVRQRAKT